MKRIGIFILLGLMMAVPHAVGQNSGPQPVKDWAMNATLIEACSCPMFCQCLFTDQPASHHDHASGKQQHFCKANIAYRVNRGHYGATKLDGALFWMAGDLGERLSDGLEWGVVTFDPSVRPEQREGISAILAHVYPFPVKDMKAGADAKIEWTADGAGAMALLDGGKAGEIRLRSLQGMTSGPVVLKNLAYIGAPRNDGFILMPSEIEAWRVGERAFEFRNSNGFMVTIDINSKDVAKKPVS